MEIKTRNTNTLLPIIISSINECGVKESSRNGPVVRFPEPVTIVLTHPWERVNFSPVRDANPFFHLLEGLAMLGNRNDARFLSHFAKNMLNYSDDGMRFNAFYGTRLREYRTKQQTHPLDALVDPIDQLVGVIDALRRNPLSRQAVALLWDPCDLIWDRTKDKACNLMLVFANDRGRLRMTSFNRSNDALWGGVCGANIVHMSMFHEYVACALGWPMGEWWHVSNNLHVYLENDKWREMLLKPEFPDPYPELGDLSGMFAPGKEMFFDHCLIHQFLPDCLDAVQRQTVITRADVYSSFFIDRVARPVFDAWQQHKAKDDALAFETISTIAAPDWRLACREWLNRRVLNT